MQVSATLAEIGYVSIHLLQLFLVLLPLNVLVCVCFCLRASLCTCLVFRGILSTKSFENFLQLSQPLLLT